MVYPCWQCGMIQMSKKMLLLIGTLVSTTTYVTIVDVLPNLVQSNPNVKQNSTGQKNCRPIHDNWVVWWPFLIWLNGETGNYDLCNYQKLKHMNALWQPKFPCGNIKGHYESTSRKNKKLYIWFFLLHWLLIRILMYTSNWSSTGQLLM